MTTPTLERPLWEVADVIRKHGAAFLAKHGGWLTTAQRTPCRPDVLRALSVCALAE